jgi:hypothetical protein
MIERSGYGSESIPRLMDPDPDLIGPKQWIRIRIRIRNTDKNSEAARLAQRCNGTTAGLGFLEVI